MSEIYREITPLTQYDCFTVFARRKTIFDFPLHSHDEYELNLILSGGGVKRIIGDHTEVIDDAELVLVGNNLPHGWLMNAYQWQEGMPEVYEITVQFHRDLFDDKFLKRNQLFFVRSLLEKSAKGISFSKETIERIKPRLTRVWSRKSGFDSILELMSILHDLVGFAVTCGRFPTAHLRMRTSISTAGASKRSSPTCATITTRTMNLAGVAKLAGMSEVSFSRFIKKANGQDVR
jgi:hypothetical protein